MRHQRESAARRPSDRAVPARRALRLPALAFVVALLAAPACGVTVLNVGRLPRAELLESPLRVGESTPEDVLRVLGPPAGQGQSQTPLEGEPRAMWAYMAERSATEGTSLRESRRGLLFVYFRDGRYDGYLWFSSLP